MRKIRVVHVLHSFGTGGLEKGIATLARHASRQVEYVIVCLANSGASHRLLPAHTPVIQMGKRLGNSMSFIWKLARTLKTLRPDVVHTRNWGGMDGILAARLAGVRAIVHGEHGWGMEDPYGLKPKRVMVRRFISLWVREYTCVSQKMENWLLDVIGVRKRITQIYNGVDSQKYHPCKDKHQVRLQLGLPLSSPLVGVVGRLDPIKNHHTLFNAFAMLRDTIPDAFLIVAGDGSQMQRLRSLAGEGVIFLGDRPDVAELLQAFDLFVLPSLNEGISNTILEAMATGLPVVAGGVGGNLELVVPGQTGTLVDPHDAQSMSSAILQCLTDASLCKRYGEAGRTKVIENFGIPAMVASYESVYQRVAHTVQHLA